MDYTSEVSFKFPINGLLIDRICVVDGQKRASLTASGVQTGNHSYCCEVFREPGQTSMVVASIGQHEAMLSPR